MLCGWIVSLADSDLRRCQPLYLEENMKDEPKTVYFVNGKMIMPDDCDNGPHCRFLITYDKPVTLREVVQMAHDSEIEVDYIRSAVKNPENK